MKLKKLLLTLIVLILLLPYQQINAESESPDITAGAALLMDSKTSKILYS